MADPHYQIDVRQALPAVPHAAAPPPPPPPPPAVTRPPPPAVPGTDLGPHGGAVAPAKPHKIK